MSDILTMQKLQDGCPVMIAKIPEQILAEIDLWVEESKGLKYHPLSTLKGHENVGYLGIDDKKHNSYQCSISPHLIDNSFWLAWVLRLTSKYWGMGKNHRHFRVRNGVVTLMDMMYGLTLHIKEMIIQHITMQDFYQV